MILADTSIWIDQMRGASPELTLQVQTGQIVQHPFVIAELALGSIKNRVQFLRYLDSMFSLKIAQIDEVRQIIEHHALYSKGIGLMDAHLIASCLLTPGTLLWTRDSALARVAQAFGILFTPPIQ